MHTVITFGDSIIHGDQLQREDTRRFRRICAEIAVPIVAFGLVAGLYRLSSPNVPPAPPVRQYVRLIPPSVHRTPITESFVPPRVDNPHQVRSAPLEKATSRHAAARRAAPRGSAGEAALASLHAQLAAFGAASPGLITSDRALVAAPRDTGGDAGRGGSVSRSAAVGSGGVGAGRDLTSRGHGVDLGTHRAALVGGNLNQAGNGREAGGGAGANTESSVAQRSLKEVQWVFDRDKSMMSSLFNAALRRHPGITAGKVVVSLSIAPDGSVTHCQLVSSSFGDPELEEALLARIRALHFGARDVPQFNYGHYPINFLLS
ncbi:TonB family protein [Burkholderia sp. Bp9012]|uniref:TonB family protein n=1 Tax=Burkholderia sp. Bp9012 TaxID=2184562 RepID=UPI0016280532|nr:TonB family protein [Burkholderia sp. Bp9012]